MTARTSFRRAGGLDRDAARFDLAAEPLAVGREAEEEVLLLGPLARALVVGAEVPRLLQLVLVVERLAARAVPAGVLPAVDRVLAVGGLRLDEARPERQDAALVALLGGADEVVELDVEALPERPELGRDLVAVLDLGNPLLAGDALDVLAVLVGARQEEGVVPREPARPRHHVGGDGRVRVPHVGDVVHVVDRRREEVARHQPSDLPGAIGREGGRPDLLDGNAPRPAARSQSSNSGWLLYTTPPRRPTFTPMVPYGVSTGTTSRSRIVRSHSWRRTPRVVVSRKRISSSASRSTGFGQDRDQHPGPALLHLYGRVEDVESPRARAAGR